MKGKIKFYFTGVFWHGRYSGNQLATFVNVGGLEEKEMQQIAREINFSETTFILSNAKRNDGYDIRIFTPLSEVDFAGHPVLGTAFVIQKYILDKPVDEIILNLKAGQIPVRISRVKEGETLFWMEQFEPQFYTTFTPRSLLPVIGINKTDLDLRYPIEEVSTGLPHVIVPLNSLDALKRISINREKYDEFIRTIHSKIILAFSSESYSSEQQLAVRVFPLQFGIAEDAATGSGNGCLAGYLLKHKYFSSDSIDIVAGQGYEIGRRSLLHLRAKIENDKYRIEIGGRVIPIAEGTWS
jgi:trans-2,3-dihydro-3-hydroxyanthranilate isomerase